MPINADITETLKTHFGFNTFRPGQAEAIQNLLDGHHSLVVMPTGSGKSLIYQLAALCLPGLTLVISPLIALMKDQVDNLQKRGIPSTFINSTIPGAEQHRRLNNLTQGKYRLVYVAPERLRSFQFLDAIKGQQVSLLAVDEAHCISEWGHDFRPDYLHIAKFRENLSKPLTVALTATATPKVQEEITRLLGLQQAERIVTGFNRPNITFEVRYTASQSAKLKAVQSLCVENTNDQNHAGGTIIYSGTRRDTEEIAEFISAVVGLNNRYYHAGLPSEERTFIQDLFMSGDLPIVVATNAFGMGIDRPDVRQVIHYSLPGSLEAYYQEAGRAGRDELPSRAVLLYSPEDRALQEWFIENSTLSLEDLRCLFDALRPYSERQESITINDLSILTGLQEVKVRIGLSELERAGAVDHLSDEGLRMRVHLNHWNVTEIRTVTEKLKHHQKHRLEQLDRMISYAESNDCRRNILLKHFGDPGPVEALICCDNCQAHPQTQVATNLSKELSQSERAVLVVLDIVRRLKQELGREKISLILKGSKAKDIVKFGYDKSVYYGRFANYSSAEIREIIDQLLELGYLKMVGGKYPVLKLTPLGEAAIKDKTCIPIKKVRYIPDEIKLRKEAERKAGGTLELTFQLLSDGLSVDQIAKQRGLTTTTIYTHTAKLIAANQILVEKVIPDDIRRKIEEAIRQVGSVEYLYPIKMLLPDEIDYNMIRCVVEGWKKGQTLITTSSIDGGEIGLTENSIDQTEVMAATIIECVRAFPGKLPRSGVAKVLVGSESDRVKGFRSYPLFNRLAGRSRLEVMTRIDQMINEGILIKEDGHLVLASADTTEFHFPRMNSLEDTHQQQPIHSQEDLVEAFLSRSHPRQLLGPWDSGWALGFHSRFTGADWSRSGVGELAYRLKYQGDLSVIPELVDQAVALIAEHPKLAQVDAVVPVPPSVVRPNDPVSSFAKGLAQHMGLPFLPLLVKSRQTSPQKEMHTLAQKHANVAGAFDLKSPVKGKSLLIIDDLFDSGATLEEITRLLHRAGTTRVNVLTLTRTIHSDA